MRGVLDRHARQVIQKYMWAAGTATAVNPIPLLDLAGGTAVSVKMVLDLAHIYRQEIDADTVITMIGQLGKNLAAMLVRDRRHAGTGCGPRDDAQDRARYRHDRRGPAPGNCPSHRHRVDWPRVRQLFPQRDAATAGRAG